MNDAELTPVQRIGDYWFKRDDLFETCGVHGGKARAAYDQITKAVSDGFNGIATAGARESPQCEIVSSICEKLGVRCALFMPSGKPTSVMENICGNRLSTIFPQRARYNNVLCSRARKYALENGWFYVPFGMESVETVRTTSKQVQNIPDGVNRIVCPVGSGMSMASILNGLSHFGRYDVEVVGVQVGKRAEKTIRRFYGDGDSKKIRFSLVDSGVDYHKPASLTSFCGIDLDPIYEAKCVPFLEQGDLLWIVGHRKHTTITEKQ